MGTFREGALTPRSLAGRRRRSREQRDHRKRASMSIEVIGAGLPRTGTLTQKVALEMLGFGPCYHWVDVLADLSRVTIWEDAMDGKVDWPQVFGESRSTVDWPGGYFWRELMDA